MKISVVLCTHNPRPDYMGRTVEGLRRQTLPLFDWEILVVDNASRESVASMVDLRWHPAARVVVEPEVGLTAARVLGFTQARCALLVCVDDDNVLSPDYLATALSLAGDWPQLGVFGCGTFTPEWETEPENALAPYLAYLAVNCATRDRWSNALYDYAAVPPGAGICVRANVARQFVQNVRQDARRKALGRTGGNLAACEDHDLAFTAIDVGYGTGVFRALKLTHLMPAARVREEYLLRLVEGHACSTVLLMALRDAQLRPPPPRWLDRIRRWRLHRHLNEVERRIEDARARGASRAWQVLQASSRAA